MSASPSTTPDRDLIVWPFPRPEQWRWLRQAYYELNILQTGSPDEVKALNRDPRDLPRPWEPASCTEPQLRTELWAWLEAVVTWLNHDYVWDPATAVPACWPAHPHLVHEIAAIADLRRRAGNACDSTQLEEWHRVHLPAFTDRMRARIREHCDEKHQPWPSRARYNRHARAETVQERRNWFAEDLAALAAVQEQHSTPSRPRLRSVDLNTGEVIDDED